MKMYGPVFVDFTGIVRLCPLLMLVISTFKGSSGQFECDVNICELEKSEFRCSTGSVILIQEVMCRSKGQNCDKIAYREITRLCSGRDNCKTNDLWYIRGQFCSLQEIKKTEKPLLSLVFVSYVCISNKALESNCSRRGLQVSPGQRYVSSPGYPALVIGSSVCSWRIAPPPGYDVDISITEYLHEDTSDKLFFRIREVLKNGLGMKLEKTSERGLTFTVKGEVEILLSTHGAVGGHRVWLEYRFVPDATLEHLRPFPLPNRTDCGKVPLINTTQFPASMPILTSNLDNRVPMSQSEIQQPSTVTIPPVEKYNTKQEDKSEHSHPLTVTTTSTSKRPLLNGTDVQHRADASSDLPLILISGALGIAFLTTVTCVIVKLRRSQKSGRGRNCLASDTISLASDRALLTSTPTQRRNPLVNTATCPSPMNVEKNYRKAGDMNLKSMPCTRDNTDISIIGQHTYQDEDFNPIDFRKYIIPSQNDAMQDSQYSEHGV